LTRQGGGRPPSARAEAHAVSVGHHRLASLEASWWLALPYLMAPGAAVPAHPLPWARAAPTAAAERPKAHRIPPLSETVLNWLACHPDSIIDLRPVKEERLVLALLHRIISKGRLDFRLAKVFQECGHEEIESALAHADLLDGIPGPMTPKVSKYEWR